MRHLTITCAAIAALLAGPASAADGHGGYSQDQIASAIDVAFGVTLTSQYVSRGVANSSGPALQGYVEASYDWAYIGVWASNVSGPDLDPDRVEIDLYGGIRHTFDDLTLDFGYAHYFYDRTGSCCGEIYAKASYAFTEEFSAGAEIYRDLTLNTNYGELNAEVSLPQNFAVSGAVGTDFAGYVTWNAGVSYTYDDTVTFDVRYHDSNWNPARFVASISFDTTWSALKGR